MSIGRTKGTYLANSKYVQYLRGTVCKKRLQAGDVSRAPYSPYSPPQFITATFTVTLALNCISSCSNSIPSVLRPLFPVSVFIPFLGLIWLAVLVVKPCSVNSTAWGMLSPSGFGKSLTFKTASSKVAARLCSRDIPM